MKLPRRSSALLAILASASVLAGCAGAPTPAQPTINPDETLLEPLPTDAGGDPVETFAAEPTSGSSAAATPESAVILCQFNPPVVAAGGSVVIVVTEAGAWYGTDRYFSVVGIPGEQVQEVQRSDGRPGTAYPVLGFEVPEYLAGAALDIGVEMRDWDILAPPALPGTASGSPRPDSTRHRFSCNSLLSVQVPV